MLNYIKAELYKTFRRKYFWVLLAVMLLLESLFGLAWVGPWSFAYLVVLMSTTMFIGSFLAVFLADMVVAEPSKIGTVKNEVSFGLTRGRVYLGKLCSAILTALLFCAVLFIWYLGWGWLLTDHSDVEGIRSSLAILGFVTAASLPLWLGVLGLTTALLMTFRSETVAAALVILYLTAGVGILSMFALLSLEPIAKAARFLLDIAPVVPLGEYSGALTWGLMGKNWCIGMGWLAGSTLVGYGIFRRREIK